MSKQPSPIDSFDIPKILRRQISNLAQKTARSAETLVTEAVQEYLTAQAFRDQYFRDAMDSGDIATDAEVQALFDKWLKHEGKVEQASDQRP